MAPATQGQTNHGAAGASIPPAQQQQQRAKRQRYQPPMRNFTGDKQKLMDALARIGINDVTRSAFFSLLGLPFMEGLAMFTKDSIKTLCAQMRDWILKREYEHDGMELSATSERYLVAMASWVKERVMMRMKVNP
jgi:hypothetical protein